jgi:hypothetical protein
MRVSTAKVIAGRARQAYLGHALIKNRNGLTAAGAVTHATGTSEREVCQRTECKPCRRGDAGADKGYDAQAFIEE